MGSYTPGKEFDFLVVGGLFISIVCNKTNLTS
jgi:hypothetical protein